MRAPTPRAVSAALLTLAASVALSAQPVRPDWDVVRVGVADDELTPDDIALRLAAESTETGAPERAPRSLPLRLAIMGFSATPLVASEAINGSASAVRNRWGWCVDANGRGGPCRALLNDFHARRTFARVFLLAGVYSTALVVASEDLSTSEAIALVASSAMAAKLAYDVGYNLEDGQPLSYEGSVASTDRLARAIGEDVVWYGTLATFAALEYVAVRALR